MAPATAMAVSFAEIECSAAILGNFFTIIHPAPAERHVMAGKIQMPALPASGR